MDEGAADMARAAALLQGEGAAEHQRLRGRRDGGAGS